TKIDATEELVVGGLEILDSKCEAALVEGSRGMRTIPEDELLARLGGVGGERGQWTVEEARAGVGAAAVDDIRDEMEGVHDDVIMRPQSGQDQFLERLFNGQRMTRAQGVYQVLDLQADSTQLTMEGA